MESHLRINFEKEKKSNPSIKILILKSCNIYLKIKYVSTSSISKHAKQSDYIVLKILRIYEIKCIHCSKKCQ